MIVAFPKDMIHHLYLVVVTLVVLIETWPAQSVIPDDDLKLPCMHTMPYGERVVLKGTLSDLCWRYQKQL